MVNGYQLEEMSQIEIDKIDKNTLIDINGVQVDSTLDASRRMQQYLEQVKNPYCFLCGDTPVRVCFSPNGKQLDSAITNYFETLKKR